MTWSLGLARGGKFRWSVNDIWGKSALGDDPSRSFVIQAAKETAAVTFVADAGPDGIDADEQSIGITIDANVRDFQNMAAGLALFPKLVAGAGKENYFTGALGQFERFGTHESEHEHIAGCLVLN